VLLGSPIWNVRAPMIMTTFTESHDFLAKTILPFVTYAVSGLGSVERDYAAACPGARIGGPGRPRRRGRPARGGCRDLAPGGRAPHPMTTTS
jgi:Flavodoxin